MQAKYGMRTILLVTLTVLFSGPFFAQKTNQPPPLFLIRHQGKFGFINQNGKVVITPCFENAGAFHDGLALAYQNGKWGFIDGTGTFVIAPQFEEGDYWPDQSLGGVLGSTSLPDDEKIKNRSSLPKIKITLTAFPFAEKLALVGKREEDLSNLLKPAKTQYGFIDRTGKFVIPPQFVWAGSFSDGLAVVQTGGKYGFIDLAGKIAIPAQFESAKDFRDGLAPVKINGLWGFINHQGEFLIPPQFSHAFPFQEGVAVVVLKETPSPLLRVVIDKTGKIVLSNGGALGSGFSEGLIPFRPVGGKTGWGYLDRTGKIVIPPQYSYTGDFSHGLARVATPDQDVWTGWSFINAKGQTVWSPTGGAGPRK